MKLRYLSSQSLIETLKKFLLKNRLNWKVTLKQSAKYYIFQWIWRLLLLLSRINYLETVTIVKIMKQILRSNTSSKVKCARSRERVCRSWIKAFRIRSVSKNSLIASQRNEIGNKPQYISFNICSYLEFFFFVLRVRFKCKTCEIEYIPHCLHHSLSIRVIFLPLMCW